MLKITFWGARGSIPVSGADFIRHGGATTCVEFELVGAACQTPSRVVVDGGSGLAALGRSSVKSWEDVLVLQTHFHWDHIQGYPLFAPFYRPSTQLRFLSVPREGASLRRVLSGQMAQPLFPVSLEALPATLEFEDLKREGRRRFGGLEVEWTEMCHPSGSTAYRLTHADASVVFSGDAEVRAGRRAELVELARGADVLIMDAQYFADEYADRRGFGHSTPEDALEIARKAEVGRLVLTHHDPGRTDDELDAQLRRLRRIAPDYLHVENARQGLQLEVGGGWRAADAAETGVAEGVR